MRPGESREEFVEGLLPGFHLVVRTGGEKPWACRNRHAGRPRKFTIEVFAEAWDQGTGVLEDEAFRRSCDGVEEPLVSGGRRVVDAKGKPIVVRRYSESLMVTLLKARRPERFRERRTVEAKVAAAQDPGPPIREVLATLSQEERDVAHWICERQVASCGTDVMG